MKIHQNVKHFTFRKSLELPAVGDVVHDRLVDMHVRIFGEKADPAHRDEREAHLEGFFDGAIDMYLAALQEGYAEAAAREITHIVGNFDFYNHGWAEMMEFPPEELGDHFDRYAGFFDAHGISLDDPLGEFVPAGGVPDAPATPGRLDDDAFANAEAGFADDVYVEDDAGDVHKGGNADAEPDL